MKRNAWSIYLLCIILLGAMTLSSCSISPDGFHLNVPQPKDAGDKASPGKQLVFTLPDSDEDTGAPSERIFSTVEATTVPTSEVPATSEMPEQTAAAETAIEIPVTESPVTEAPVTEAPITEAPVTEAPVTEAPITEAPVTEAPVTEAPTTEPPATTPEPPPTDQMSPIRQTYLEGINYIMQYDFGYIPNIENVHFIELSVRQQETGEYCALASTQAMLSWHYVNRSQSELATTMNYIPGFGVYNADALAGLNAEMLNSQYPDQLYQLAPMDRSEGARSLFYQRIIDAIANRRPLMYIVLMSDLYGNAPGLTHNIIGTGWIENPETGSMDYLIVEDPAPSQWGAYGGMKIFPTWQIVQAIENSIEPEYFY